MQMCKSLSYLHEWPCRTLNASYAWGYLEIGRHALVRTLRCLLRSKVKLLFFLEGGWLAQSDAECRGAHTHTHAKNAHTQTHTHTHPHTLAHTHTHTHTYTSTHSTHTYTHTRFMPVNVG